MSRKVTRLRDAAGPCQILPESTEGVRCAGACAEYGVEEFVIVAQGETVVSAPAYTVVCCKNCHDTNCFVGIWDDEKWDVDNDFPTFSS